jgi:hypothetical protein
MNAGGHWLGSPALALLEWELSGAAVAALGSLQGECKGNIYSLLFPLVSGPINDFHPLVLSRGSLRIFSGRAHWQRSNLVGAPRKRSPARLAEGASGAAAAAPQSGQAQAPALSERGVLQLLFDAQLLRAALAGGRPPGGGGPAAPHTRWLLPP